MFEVPIGPGPVAAIVFVLFELVLLPIVMDSTTKASSLLIQRQGLKNEAILVRSIPFGPWGDGLIGYRRPLQLLLLIVRITCIVIPVYLETKLDFVERPSPIQLRHAFVPKSSFEQKKFDNMTYLSGSKLASRLCTYIDEDDWLVGRIANSSMTNAFGEPEFEKIQCMQSTEERMFRALISSGPGDGSWNLTEELEISGIVPEKTSADIESISGATKIRNWNIENRGFQVRCLHGFLDSQRLQLTCHRISERTVHLFLLNVSVRYRLIGEGRNIKTFGDIYSPGEEFRISVLPSAVNFNYLNTEIKFEFHDEVLFDSRFFTKKIVHIIFTRFPNFRGSSFAEMRVKKIQLINELSRYLLYSYTQDIILTLPTQNLRSATLVGKEVIAIVTIEVVCILLFAISMKVLFISKIQSCPPNTFRGVLQAWMNTRYSAF